jgi:hypothetical protein
LRSVGDPPAEQIGVVRPSHWAMRDIGVGGPSALVVSPIGLSQAGSCIDSLFIPHGWAPSITHRASFRQRVEDSSTGIV